MISKLLFVSFNKFFWRFPGVFFGVFSNDLADIHVCRVWRPTSLRNEDILKCIKPFLTQRVLKLWWSWIYQNSTVKHTSTRVLPRWVTSWEIWFREAKSGQYCVIRGKLLQMISESLPSLRWGECAQAHEGRQRGRWVPRGGDCDVPHYLGMGMCLYV
jgi:hypothetical protein